MQTAGRAVVFSGTAVAIGLALMLFMPLPFMRGFGIGGLLIPLVSVLAALTLLPVLIWLLEDRLDRVRLLPKAIVERRQAEENFWVRLARWIMRRPVAVAAASVAVLVALAVPVLSLELGPGSNQGIPQDLEGVQGLNVVTDALGEGALAPTQPAARRPVGPVPQRRGDREFGFGLATAILIDVTIIRALLVPSVMKLFGRWDWWLPERVARVLRVPPSPLASATGSPVRATAE
jgi:RND superfamily putative drug exporter